MPDHDAVDERLRAVERALTDADADDLTDLRDAAELAREVESLAERLDEVEERLDRLDAATQALRGYVGNVRAVNQSVERTADAALAKAEALESDDRASDSTGFGTRSATPGSATGRACACPPCECASRRPDHSGTLDDPSAPDGESGDEHLLTRVGESLAGLLTRTQTEDP